MTKRWETCGGKVALVTGASRGIGRAIAQRLAAEGARVAVTARTLRPGDGTYAGSLEETVDAIVTAGGHAVPVVADLADVDADRGEIVRAAEHAFDAPVDILVNNAAAARRFELRFEGMDAATFREQVEVNVWAAWDLMLAALPGMRARGGGWVLNISSQGAAPKVGPPYRAVPMVGAQCLYGSTKAMLDRFTTGAAMELHDDGIAVNALAPEGAVATENARTVAGVRDDRSEPLETMAEAALALCTGDPAELTGRVTASLSLIVERNLAVHTLDGTRLVEGRQPDQIDRARLARPYLERVRERDDDMTTALDDDVRLLDTSWFMSYPHDVYARLRREAPVYWSERDGLWAISKYDDVRSISKRPEQFGNAYHIYVAAASVQDDGQPSTDELGLPRRAELRRRDALGPLYTDNVVMADGERHRFLRKIAGYAFTPKAIGEIEAEVQRIAEELFDAIPAGVEVDFIDTVAAPLPMIMIALMLGVPVEDLDRFRRWSDAFIEMSDESIGDQRADRVTEILEFRDYFTEQLRNRAVHPRDDLLTKLTEARWHGEPLAIDEQLSMAQILLIAGNETTRGLIAGAGLAMAEQPDQRRILVESPELIVGAVEEFLRYVTPVTHMCRTALDDVEVRGARIAKGDFLCLLYAAANRDEEVWARADELDVTRAPDPSHLAFGFAEHFCLGASLARREAKIVLTELLSRFPDYELVGPITRTRQHMTPGISTMPVVFHR